MKKIVFAIVMILTAVYGYSQVLIKPNSSGTAIACFMINGANDIHLNCDTANNYYLAIERTHKSIDDYIDAYNYKNYSFSKMVTLNKHMYIKLNNDSIITLTCMSYLFENEGYELEQVGRSVEWVYKTNISSIFKLSDYDVNALKTYDIVKLRLEFNNEYFDLELKPEKYVRTHEQIASIFDSLNEKYNTYIENSKKQMQSEQRQKMIKNDPLYDF